MGHCYPGPLHMRVLCCNVRASTGARSLLHHCHAEDPHSFLVLCLQETRFSYGEFEAFRRHAHKSGFRVFHVSGRPHEGSHGNQLELGGTTILVDGRLQTGPHYSLVGTHSQVIGLWVEDWFVCTFYAPPWDNSKEADPQIEAGELFHSLAIQAGFIDTCRWIACGDANEIPDDSVLASCFQFHGAVIPRSHQGTRWESNREIDWYAICTDSGAGTPTVLEVHVSDHKVLSCDFQFKDRNTKVGYLSKGPSWVLPQGLGKDQWRKLLRDTWVRLPSAAQFLQQVSLPDASGTVEEDWDQFLKVLDDLHREAFWELSQTSDDPRICFDAAARCRNTTVKGHVPTWKERNAKRRNAKANDSDMKLVKSRKRVARLYELIRLTKVQISMSEHPERTQNAAARDNLLRRLRLTSQPSLRELLSLLRSAKAELQEMETKVREERLSGWRHLFSSDLKFAGKWLRSSQATTGIQIKDDEGLSRSPQEAVGKIHRYWDQFWQQLKAETPPTEQITAQLLQNTIFQPEETFQVPSAEELASVAAAMRGSGGGDAWVGSELSCLPLEVWQTFRILVEKWLQEGKVPAAVKAARTVFLPKDHKIIEGVLQAGDARPITVLSSWWRVLIGTWLKGSQAHHWVTQTLHPVVVYGKQGDSQVAAGSLLEAYTQAGFLCSLDYTKCFDCLRPSSSIAMFLKTGLDSRFCAIIGDLWNSHVRWPSWGGTVHSEGLATHGLPIPQGECLGPTTCCLWLSAGQRYVETHMGAALTSSIYMDDRSFVARSAEELVRAQQCWADWSKKVGLLESASKTQMTARSKAQKQTLQALIPAEWYRSDITMLGVVTKGAPRCNAQQERERLNKAKQRLTKLSMLCLGSELFAVYARVFCLSLCSYGWLSRLPRKMD